MNRFFSPLQLFYRFLLPFFALAGIVALLFVYYSADHRHPPCCDTAISLMKAKQIASQGTVRTIQTYNPSAAEPLYGSPISTEAALHLLLAGIYRINPGLSYDLGFAKSFFVILFLLPSLTIFLLGKEVSKSASGGVLAVVFTYLSFWFGNMYWTGHVAQMLGVFFIPLFVHCLYRYDQYRKRKYLWFSYGIMGVTFFVHVLTFLILLLIAITHMTLVLFAERKKKWPTVMGYIGFALLVMVYLKFVPTSTSLLPSFGENSLVYSFPSIIDASFGVPFLLVLAGIGAVYAVHARLYVILLWFIVSYFLSQSTLYGTSFFSFRFSEFLVLPLMILGVIGFRSVLTLLPGRILGTTALATLLALYIPYGLSQQQSLKQCYVSNCPDLNATQVTESDLQAFTWMKKYLPSPSIVAAHQKFGYYLPITTDHLVEFPVGEKRDIFTHPDPRVRWELAKKYHIQYIFWDSIFAQGWAVREAEDFRLSGFKYHQYFTKIYDRQGARIFTVR